ncbi:MAG: hypothetical protein FWB99_03665 [Treponema sp.]|nr:hypothetical protein [Treponema sp.]
MSQSKTTVNAVMDDLQPELTEEERRKSRKAKLEQFLTGRLEQREKPYGIFEADVTMCRFFGTSGAEELLADIEGKNREQGEGNYQIPGTSITLINFSVCPKCGAVFSFQDLKAYYGSPRPDPAFKNGREQYRNDTRVFCYPCETYFLPALVISDGTPVNEVQFLCRMQTVEAIEKYYAQKGRRVLTKKAGNIIPHGNMAGRKTAVVLNDILLEDLQERPALISNIIQYTPANLALNMIEGTNVEKKDILFGIQEWKV